MRHIGFRVLIAIACFSEPVPGGERIVIGDDGSVAGRFPCGSPETQPIELDFGLPRTPAARMWRENETLRSEWITKGIRYTQTALLSVSRLDMAYSGINAPVDAVLLVDIEGENLNSHYTEAAAELSLKINGERQELELQEGLLWRVEGKTRSLLGALEIPGSGIRVSSGEVLGFSGNMPPSVKGSMTIKIPLGPIAGDQAVERLRDLEFREELRHSLKPSKASFPGAGHRRLVFASEAAPTGTNAELTLTSPPPTTALTSTNSHSRTHFEPTPITSP